MKTIISGNDTHFPRRFSCTSHRICYHVPFARLGEGHPLEAGEELRQASPCRRSGWPFGASSRASRVLRRWSRLLGQIPLDVRRARPWGCGMSGGNVSGLTGKTGFGMLHTTVCVLSYLSCWKLRSCASVVSPPLGAPTGVRIICMSNSPHPFSLTVNGGCLITISPHMSVQLHFISPPSLLLSRNFTSSFLTYPASLSCRNSRGGDMLPSRSTWLGCLRRRTRPGR